MIRHLSPRLSRPFAAALLGVILLALPSAAMAQAPAAKAAPAAVEARIKSLHDALQITPAQEGQWQAVTAAMRDNAQTISALIAERVGKAKTMTAIDDLHSYEAIADAHAAGVKKLTAAFEPLYASLSDAQKKRADDVFRRRHPSPAKKSG